MIGGANVGMAGRAIGQAGMVHPRDGSERDGVVAARALLTERVLVRIGVAGDAIGWRARELAVDVALLARDFGVRAVEWKWVVETRRQRNKTRIDASTGQLSDQRRGKV